VAATLWVALPKAKRRDPEGRDHCMTYYERDLPHWHPEGADLFVTWRLFGSLPAGVRCPVVKTGKEFADYDRVLDTATVGPLWLKDDRVAECIANSLHFAESQLKLFELHAWVVMCNHVHALWTPHVPLPEIMDRIKTFTAREANRILGRAGSFWQSESFDRWVRNEKEFHSIVSYIEENPVKAGLCTRAEDWKWSSARPGGSRPLVRPL
jgi:REP element-mobilizing transposase RayT